jgi:hypothetical protein
MMIYNCPYCPQIGKYITDIDDHVIMNHKDKLDDYMKHDITRKRLIHRIISLEPNTGWSKLLEKTSDKQNIKFLIKRYYGAI